MLLGIPKETKVHEYRVGMTPASARMVSTLHPRSMDKRA